MRIITPTQITQHFGSGAEFTEAKPEINNDNYGGIIGLSLIKAYNVSGDVYAISTARNYADRVVEAYYSQNDKNKKVFYSMVVFLSELSSVTGLDKYQKTSEDMALHSISKYKDTSEVFYKYYLHQTRSLELIGYDMAWQIKSYENDQKL